MIKNWRLTGRALRWATNKPKFGVQLNVVARRSFSFSLTSDQSSSLDIDLIKQLPPQFLRSSDTSNFDPSTQQRCNVNYNFRDGKPVKTGSTPSTELLSCSLDEDEDLYQVHWQDGHVSEFSVDWVHDQLSRWNGTSLGQNRVLWTGMTEEKLRSSNEMTLQFSDFLTERGMKHALRAMHQFGILLVTNTPIDDNNASIAVMSSCCGGGTVKSHSSLLKHYLTGDIPSMAQRASRTDGPLRTLYGTIWSMTTSSQHEGTSTADSAYGHGALPLHTDLTYYRDPAGVQIFTMVQPASVGGECVYCDGFAAAQKLRETDNQSFMTLCHTIRRYRSIDQEQGWHLEANGPVISLYNDQVVAIRHNDLDRLPDLPSQTLSTQEKNDFYSRLEEAHFKWDDILASDDMRLVINMQAGDTILLANQRCLHGRYSFETNQSSPRTISGCYVSKDEFDSRLRMEGYDVV